MGQTIHSTQLDNSGGRTLGIRLQGRISKEYNQTFLFELQRLMAKFKKIRVLLELKGLLGVPSSELWQRLNFESYHFRACERLALVAEGDWAKATVELCKPFSIGTVKCFSPAELGNARIWLDQD